MPKYLLPLCAIAALAAVSPKAKQIHDSAIVIDTHMDTLQRVLLKHADLGVRSKNGQADLPRLREGGVKAQVFAVWVDPMYAPYRSARRTLQLIDAMQSVLKQYPDRVELAQSASDIRRIARSGKLAALMGIEGGHAIENDLALLRMYRQLGVIYMTLTHSNTNDWADSSTDAPRSHGLSPFGREVVKEMNRIGMLVDISHVSDETVRAVLATSTKPVIASHSSCRALCNHPRNLSDDLLRAIGQKGGYIGINFYSAFVDQNFKNRASGTDQLKVFNSKPKVDPDKLDQVAAERANIPERTDIPRPPFSILLDHLDHAVKVAGIDHVGIGSDLDVVPTPEGMDDVTDFPKITEGLLQRGYSEQDIRKILGENFLRVLQQATGK